MRHVRHVVALSYDQADCLSTKSVLPIARPSCIRLSLILREPSKVYELGLSSYCPRQVLKISLLTQPLDYSREHECVLVGEASAYRIDRTSIEQCRGQPREKKAENPGFKTSGLRFIRRTVIKHISTTSLVITNVVLVVGRERLVTDFGPVKRAQSFHSQSSKDPEGWGIELETNASNLRVLVISQPTPKWSPKRSLVGLAICYSKVWRGFVRDVFRGNGPNGEGSYTLSGLRLSRPGTFMRDLMKWNVEANTANKDSPVLSTQTDFFKRLPTPKMFAVKGLQVLSVLLPLAHSAVVPREVVPREEVHVDAIRLMKCANLFTVKAGIGGWEQGQAAYWERETDFTAQPTDRVIFEMVSLMPLRRRYGISFAN
ncbi:uncharacterized protein BDR25DRAFT_361499 [Lindgomyces ingoldianus]|uniref:Uncharacterized protein n=1 Tax=Lindgomyces ingoldianus TaxID=673940 RepID=A0ACB6QDI1_9PLEO|nr:uncharacterized protein BDR25DRAFT_361499 [Lindgomyces ingoldianus]KAF2464427.1 hypothetical protein BDR25DRAFT_361499 [Lindgomyces ingoldianus]